MSRTKSSTEDGKALGIIPLLCIFLKILLASSNFCALQNPSTTAVYITTSGILPFSRIDPKSFMASWTNASLHSPSGIATTFGIRPVSFIFMNIWSASFRSLWWLGNFLRLLPLRLVESQLQLSSTVKSSIVLHIKSSEPQNPVAGKTEDRKAASSGAIPAPTLGAVAKNGRARTGGYGVVGGSVCLIWTSDRRLRTQFFRSNGGGSRCSIWNSDRRL
ncbi:pentatricopeptide repeat-containing protein [Pyrus ussuriensis x Pyrus communis]|uniref:Pentatricopeptide repeat-containing protein n=1 Tax=Pyrus ussuriensis x Pyrus communis TaxID=2448454 RepID=A0A5N5FA63_9ROSA|nr:pentatricopeptide repeat-containing protein [Pyrus ussuriensis x Pyrus communis]